MNIGTEMATMATDRPGMIQALQQLQKSPLSAEGKRLQETALKFEELLLAPIVENMSRTIPESELFDSAMTRQTRGMFWSMLGEDLAAKGGMGLGKELLRQYMANPAAESTDAASLINTLE